MHFLEQQAAERSEQTKQWGGPHHDDGHYTIDWIDFLRKQMRRANAVAAKAERIDAKQADRDEFCSRMVKIAALAQAAAESAQRRWGEK